MLSNKFSNFFILLLVSLAVGLIGSALSKSSSLDPQLNRAGLQGVARDGWMEARASIRLSKEYSASQLRFTFDAWRPRRQGPAQLSFLACDKEIASTEVSQKNSSFSLKFPPECQNLEIVIVTHNPFRASDGRILGAKLLGVKIKPNLMRSLKFDNVAWIASFAVFFVLTSFCYIGLPKSTNFFAGALFCALTLYSMNFLEWDNQWQLLCLALVLTLFCLGLSCSSAESVSRLQKLDSSIPGSAIWVAIIFIAAATLRYYRADFGLPDRYHPDEPRKASIALRMASSGNMDPNYFLHPTLLLYLTALWGRISYELGFFSELGNVAMNYSGRLVSATAGALAVPVLYLIGRDLFTKRVGMLAALCLAFAPLNVTCSRYLKEDSLLCLFVLISTWLVARAVKRDRPRELLLAAFVAGLASSSKYSGVLACAAIAFSPWLKSGSVLPDLNFLKWGFVSSIFVPVGFVIASPYTVLNFERFISNFSAEREHMTTGHHKVVISSWSQYWVYHFSRSVLPGATWPVAVIGLFGLGLALRRKTTQGIFVLLMFLAFYLPAEAVNAKPPPQPERYILPSIPFLILAGAYALDSLKFFNKYLLRIFCTLSFILTPLITSLCLAYYLKPDTRVLMSNWIAENIPKGSKIVIDAQAYSAFVSPQDYKVQQMWSIPQRRAMTFDAFKAQGIDYVLLSDKSYERYFLTRSADQLIRSRFQDVFDKWKLVRKEQIPLGKYGFSNPTLSLYKVELNSASGAEQKIESSK